MGANDFHAMRTQLGTVHAPNGDNGRAVRAVLLRYERGQLTAEEALTVLNALGLAEPPGP